MIMSIYGFAHLGDGLRHTTDSVGELLVEELGSSAPKAYSVWKACCRVKNSCF
jgi:hypothetical protein